MSESPSLTDVIGQAVAQGAERLDAQCLLLHTLGRPGTDRAWLVAHGTDTLTHTDALHYAALVQRILQGEPLAYLLGEKEFFGLPLAVDDRVLVPRADTETLVQWALDLLPEANAGLRVLDLGTGSGAIALALARHRPLARVSAVDASADALTVARANATRLGLPVQFIQGSWLDPVQESFDVIVSNPPYIAQDDPHLAALAHEPRAALVAGADGLQDLRQIISSSPAHLTQGGWLLLEHGYDQADAVRALLVQRGFDQVQSRHDLAGIERCSGGRWQSAG